MKKYKINLYDREIIVTQNEDGTFNKPDIVKDLESKGTATKPAHEPIILCRKPLSEKTIVENVLKHGTGAIDIDGCRIPTTSQDQEAIEKKNKSFENANGKEYEGIQFVNENRNLEANTQGRFPANIICTDDALNDGEMTKSTNNVRKNKVPTGEKGIYNKYEAQDSFGHSDSGSKSRYFNIDVWAEKYGLLQYPKASKRERNEGCEGLEEKVETIIPNNPSCSICGGNKYDRKNGMSVCECENPIWNKSIDKPNANHHPTVKPVHLMSWLVRLVSKEGDVVLDPFAGSGTTGVACKKLNRNFILIEQNEEYIEIIKKRVADSNKNYGQQTLFGNEM